MVRLVTLVLLLPLASCARQLEDGVYSAEVLVVGLDTCEDGEELAEGERFELDLSVRGDTVTISSKSQKLHLPGGLQDPQSSKPRPPLVGRFLSGEQDEVFIADTNFEVVKTIAHPDLGPISCDSLAHISIPRGLVESPERFTGLLRKTYDPKPEASPACIRGCVVELEFAAARR